MKRISEHSKHNEDHSPSPNREESDHSVYARPQSRRNISIFILGAGAIIAANNLNLGDVNFILYKIVVIFVCNSALLLAENYNRWHYGIKITQWIACYLAANSFFYSLVHQQHLPFQDYTDFHLQSCKNDTLSLIMMISLFWLVVDPSEIEASRTSLFGLIAVALNSLTTLLILQQQDIKFLVSNIAYGLLLVLAGRFVLQKLATYRIKFEDEISKKSEAVQQELSMIKDDIEDSYANITKTVSSQGDELLMKLKFLKFQNLLERNEKERSSTSQSLRDQFKQKQFEEASIKGSADTQNKWGLTSEDVDLIISNIIKKSQAGLWIPDALARESSTIAHDTYDFLLQNFTEKYDKVHQSSTIKKMEEVAGEGEIKMIDLDPLNEYLANATNNWNTDMQILYDLSKGNHLVEYGHAISKKFKLSSLLKIDKGTLSTFLHAVQNGYFKNPYHNSLHGADVANSVAFMLQNGFNNIFNHMETACMIISGLVHDLDHPGVNNPFMIATQSVESLVYNDQSVLENFHVAQFYRILQNPQTNILKNLDEKEWNFYRKFSISLILDTDLQKHFPLMNKFKNAVAIKQINIQEESDRFLIGSMVMKAADIGHGAKELSLHKKWSRRILEEFYQQGDKELEKKIPVSPLCDRKGSVAKSQKGFLDFIVVPLFQVMDDYCNNTAFTTNILENVKKNIEYWDQELAREQHDEASFMQETQKVIQDIVQFQS